MLLYWIQMLVGGWHNFTVALGNTTLGFWLQVGGVPIVTFVVTICAVGLQDGKDKLMGHINGALIKRAFLIAFFVDVAIYGPVLGYQILRAIYEDRNNLFQTVHVEGGVREAQRQQDINEFRPLKESLEAQLQRQTVDCARIGGENTTLHKQSVDQQTLIAGCQEDAIKRLAPERQRLTALPYDSIVNGVDHKDTLLFITNAVVTNTYIQVYCNVHITSAEAHPVAISTRTGGAELVNNGFGIKVTFTSPSWTPTFPISLTYTYVSSRTAECRSGMGL